MPDVLRAPIPGRPTGDRARMMCRPPSHAAPETNRMGGLVARFREPKGDTDDPLPPQHESRKVSVT